MNLFQKLDKMNIRGGIQTCNNNMDYNNGYNYIE